MTREKILIASVLTLLLTLLLFAGYVAFGICSVNYEFQSRSSDDEATYSDSELDLYWQVQRFSGHTIHGVVKDPSYTVIADEARSLPADLVTFFDKEFQLDRGGLQGADFIAVTQTLMCQPVPIAYWYWYELDDRGSGYGGIKFGPASGGDWPEYYTIPMVRNIILVVMFFLALSALLVFGTMRLI